MRNALVTERFSKKTRQKHYLLFAITFLSVSYDIVKTTHMVSVSQVQPRQISKFLLLL